MALAYQLEVEANGVEHIKTEPTIKKSVVVDSQQPAFDKVEKIAGFFMSKTYTVNTLAEQVADVTVQDQEETAEENIANEGQDSEDFSDVDTEEEQDDDDGWITPGNIAHVKISNNGVLETIQLDVACLTTDFAMQVNINEN